ncbi:unnamed protein product [Schistosoma rodhaini]|uniref:Sodium/potassium-transporting ATPase subunit beta n=1 Tax=Schistosoma rodhaini TaxID=6188 RepID=A0AA85EQS3_9TREM|nr:unnamed protein product [Schistosoma rodhaini]
MHYLRKRYKINKILGSSWLYQPLTTTSPFRDFICLMKLVLYKIIDADKPYLTGSYSSLENTPGLSIVPVISTEMNLVAYKDGKPDTFLIFQDMLIAFLSQYEYYSYTGNNMRDCLMQNDSQALTYGTLVETSCLFNLDWSYACNINNYFGFDSGSPCVIIKLNRIYGWLPDIRSNENGIKICCKGANPNDDILLGTICLYDAYIHTEEGCGRQCAFIPHQYFPYLNQESYQSPLIFLQFQNVRKNVLMQIHCETVNLPNKMGVNFALLVD